MHLFLLEFFSVFWLKFSLLLLWLLLPYEWLFSTVLGFSEVTAGCFTVSISCSTLVTGLTIGFFGTSGVVTLFTDVIRFTPTDPIAVLTEDGVINVTPVDTFGLSRTREVFVFIFDVS